MVCWDVLEHSMCASRDTLPVLLMLEALLPLCPLQLVKQIAKIDPTQSADGQKYLLLR